MRIISKKKKALRNTESRIVEGKLELISYSAMGAVGGIDNEEEDREYRLAFYKDDIPALKKILKTLVNLSGVLAVMLLAGCGKPVTPPAECAPSNGHALYVFGDSITYSLDGNSYANMMGCAKGYKIVNMAVGGTSIEFGNQYAMIMAHQRNWIEGDVVVFSPGENDAVLYSQDAAHVADYTSKVTDIVTMMATKKVQVYFGTPNYSCHEARFGSNTDRDVYAQISRDVIASQGAANIHLVDFTQKFLPTAENTYDCLHPNGAGNKAMELILEAEMN
jgi:lysophospholipase L1-like esterase